MCAKTGFLSFQGLDFFHATGADLTIEEFRAIIRETVRETVRETMLEKDPDAGLELSDEVIEILSQPVSEEGRITIEELAVKHGFKW